MAERWIAAWNAHDLDSIMTHYEDSRKDEFESSLSTRAGSPSGTAFSSGGRVRGCKQRGATLHKSKGETHRRVHGIVGDWEGGTNCGQLHC
jgi:hypothetical protein